MIVDCAVYENGRRRPGTLQLQDAYEAGRGPDCFVWIGLYEPTEEEFESVRKEFNLHELAVEDAIEAHQRPKLEVYDETLFVVLKTVRYDDLTETVEFGEIQLFVGDGFIVSVRHGEASSLAGVRRSYEDRPELLKHGPGAVLHAVVDRVVDDYAPVIVGLDNDIDEVESQVFSPGRDNPGERIYKLISEVLDLHRATSPLLTPMDRLSRGNLPHIDEEVQAYFRDVHDHMTRIVEQVQGFRELLTNALAANLTQVSVRQNEDMRRISAWAALIALPTLIAGIYGMNFRFMPELDWAFGYPVIMAAMVVIEVILYRYFRKSGWL